MANGTVIGTGEFRGTAPITSTIRLASAPDTPVQVRHSTIDRFAIFEGDIILGRDVELLGTAIRDVGARWPARRVVFDIDPGLANQQRVHDAIAHWEQRTIIRFKQKTTETAFVLFKTGSGCASAVGKTGGVQHLTLTPQCQVGNVIHEIGHAVGLWHEQSRTDRDQFVTIDLTNVVADQRHNFDQHLTDGDDIGAYDYGSIMHYPRDAFAIDVTKPTVVTPHGEAIGQRNGLSAGDIAAVAAIYANIT